MNIRANIFEMHLWNTSPVRALSLLISRRLRTIWFNSFYVPRCQHDDGYIDGRSQTKVHTDERTQVQPFGLPWRSPIQVLTEVDVA